MLTKLFSCSACHQSYDRKEGELRCPVWWMRHDMICCRRCTNQEEHNLVQRGLMEFLDQPAFNKVYNGYHYCGPFNNPMCFGCQGTIKISDGCAAFIAPCGHYLCQGCDLYRKNNPPQLCCRKCRFWPDDRTPYPTDILLAAFSHQAKDVEMEELIRHLKERETEIEEVRADAKRHEEIEQKHLENREFVKMCSECDIERPIERLYKCYDCRTIVCGDCVFDSHQIHVVTKLHDAEFDELEQHSIVKYGETVGAVRGNLKYIHTAIDEAVQKVLVAGKDRLAKIAKCSKYVDAHKIVSKVDDAADKFEKHCEVYIPVARQLASELTDLGEELIKSEE